MTSRGTTAAVSLTSHWLSIDHALMLTLRLLVMSLYRSTRPPHRSPLLLSGRLSTQNHWPPTVKSICVLRSGLSFISTITDRLNTSIPIGFTHLKSTTLLDIIKHRIGNLFLNYNYHLTTWPSLVVKSLSHSPNTAVVLISMTVSWYTIHPWCKRKCA